MPMVRNPFPLPRQGEHVAIFGMTGSGKTYLASRLVNRAKYVVCLDTKRTMDLPENQKLWRATGYQFFEDFDELKRAGSKGVQRLVYQPDQTEFAKRSDELERFDEFFHWIYNRKNTLAYIDEAFLVCDGNYIPRYYRACLTQGRELGISCYAASQRPVSISQLILSETSHVFSFRLRMEQDREKLSATLGYDVDFLRTVPKRYFYYLSEIDYKGKFKVR